MEKISLGHYHHQLVYDKIINGDFEIEIPKDLNIKESIFIQQIRNGVQKSNKILKTEYVICKVGNVLKITNKKPLTPEKIFSKSIKQSGDIYVPKIYDIRQVIKHLKSSKKEIIYIDYLKRIITLNVKSC